MNDSKEFHRQQMTLYSDFSSGKSWHNKVSHDNLNMHDENLSTEENKLLWRSRLHPDDSDRIIKVLTPVILEPQIHGQMSFAFKIRWYLW
jgi:hypothetical protein